MNNKVRSAQSAESNVEPQQYNLNSSLLTPHSSSLTSSLLTPQAKAYYVDGFFLPIWLASS